MRRQAILLFSLALGCFAATAATDRARDEKITARVKGALVEDDAPGTRQVEVQTRDGVVQLSGFVESHDIEEDVVLTARDVDGVMEVRNDLTIRKGDDFTARNSTDDAVVGDGLIAARVKNKLVDDAELASPDEVSVEVDNGIVQLGGFVSTPQEKTRAADAVSSVPGVKDVRNNIALAQNDER